MTWTRRFGLGLALLLPALAARAEDPPPIRVVIPTTAQPRDQPAVRVVIPAAGQPQSVLPARVVFPTFAQTQPPEVPDAGTPGAGTPDAGAPGGGAGETPPASTPSAPEGLPETNPAEESALGPTPLPKVGLLNKWLYGDNADKAPIKFAGWLDGDYTFRSTGRGRTNIAPVENRFGDEFLFREAGLWVYKPLDEKTWSWGFNSIFIAGSDASFLGPTAGGWANTNPRFGGQWTDLNLTAHLPIFTEGGVDIKAGRQTTVLGPMGALAWQRPFTSSDYAWYNLEEGRYTGVSATWHVSKQLDWYNGVEIGGWGVFFDNPSRTVDYITQVVYWLDEAAKKTKVFATVLTGPTGFHGTGNTTTTEIGFLHNWNKYFYTIVDNQNTYSKQPLFFAAPKGYQERAYDVYTYNGYHMTKTVDLTSRFEWYKDVDGGGYPGGFGIPHTDYTESTLGLDYHPYSWIQMRPEIRYDHATHPAFGERQNFKNQLEIAADVLLKF